MACYRRFRGLCTVWCSFEILFFAGIIYGWNSLVFIFTDEGFYEELCEENLTMIDIDYVNYTNIIIFQQNLSQNENKYISNMLDYNKKTCADQESRLGLWFSIGVGCTWAGMAILGPLSRAVGTRITRILILLVYEAGLFCLAFTTRDTTWLICPGLCCIGVGGLALFASNIQVSNLFPTFSSTVVALFCGLFDSSAVVLQLVKIAYGLGIGRRESFLFFACLHLIMVGTSTFFILPKCYITFVQEDQDFVISVDDKDEIKYSEILQPKEKRDSNSNKVDIKKTTKYGVTVYLKSFTYVTHVVWMTVNCLLFATFLNLLYTTIHKLAKGEAPVVGYYLGVFAYTTMGSLVGSLMAGLIYDFERKRYSDCDFPEKKWKPVVIPMAACGVFITAVFSLMLFANLTFLFPSFIVFTLFRNFLYSIGVAFVNEAFPTEYFGPLYGIMTFLNGLFSLIQYGFVKWTLSSSSGYRHAHLVLLTLAAITFLHPIQLWIRSNKAKKMKPLNSYEETLMIQPT